MKKLEIVDYSQLRTEFGIKDSRSTLSRKMRANPPKFPQCVQKSEGRIAWFRHEVQEHVANLKRGHAVNYRAKKAGA